MNAKSAIMRQIFQLNNLGCGRRCVDVAAAPRRRTSRKQRIERKKKKEEEKASTLADVKMAYQSIKKKYVDVSLTTKGGFGETAPVATKIERPDELEVLTYPHKQLRQTNAEIAVFDDNLRQLARDMFDLMYTFPGLGLAAPQVGVNLRLLVFNKYGHEPAGKLRDEGELVLINPVIVSYSGGQTMYNESCLSFPGIEGRIEGVLFHDRMSDGVFLQNKQNLLNLEAKYKKEFGGQPFDSCEDRRGLKAYE